MSLVADLDKYQSRAFRLVQPGRTVVLVFGRGSGKTFLLALLIHYLALEKPGRKIGLILPSLKQARAVFWVPHLLPAYYGPIKRYLKGPPNRTELTAEYVNGSRLSTWGMENAGAIRGQRFDVLIQDETDDMSLELEASIVRPTLSRSGRNAIVVKAGTYTRGRYGILYRDMQLVRGNDPGFFGFTVTSEQSPQVDQQWLAAERHRTNSRTYQREYLCNPDTAEGLVYPIFVEAPNEVQTSDGPQLFTHVAPINPEIVWQEVLVGVDWGYEHPGVFLVVGVAGHGRDTTCQVIREVYERAQSPTWWIERAKEIKAIYPNAKWFAGPDRPERISELKEHAKVNIQGALNSVKEGIDMVADLMHVRERDGVPIAQLYVAPECVNTIREFGQYRRRRDPKTEGQFLDDVEKRNDDAMDALRYAIFSRWGKPLSRRTERGAEVYEDAG